MSNIDGVMKDPKDKDSLLHKLTVVETEALKKDGTINGGMIPRSMPAPMPSRMA